MPEPAHRPVLLERVCALIDPAVRDRPAVVVDTTVGLGGYAVRLLTDHPGLHLVGIDRDPDALAVTRERLAPYSGRFTLVRKNFAAIPDTVAELSLPQVDAILFDLGVSSLQIDAVGRGFSYARDAPLDMRMDPAVGPTAADILNTYDVAALTRVLRDYGEERYAGRIADAIVRDRRRAAFTTSARLVELIYETVPAPARRRGGHPAKRSFQALRIEVNRELDALRVALPAACAALRAGGRIVVLAYHSLEDRIVKQTLSTASRDTTPLGLPVVLAGTQARFRLLTRGAEQPSAAEIADNPRAASARLRAAERRW